mmetsp:Transcript_59826/g.142492  ORF Transcript_59826/g.142492 Transcript_59826/m.142492 type:complete len:641 (+) Transcript_59826:38-1960(+)
MAAMYGSPTLARAGAQQGLREPTPGHHVHRLASPKPRQRRNDYAEAQSAGWLRPCAAVVAGSAALVQLTAGGGGSSSSSSSGSVRRRRTTQRHVLQHEGQEALAEKESSKSESSETAPSSSVLGSLLDLPRSKALGIEFRATSALAAPVSSRDGSLLEDPFRIKHSLHGSARENAAAAQATLKQIIKHFQWKGVVGCSVTREVALRLGIEEEAFSAMEIAVGKIFSPAIRSCGNVPFAHTMVHTTPATYTGLVWGTISDTESWHDKVLLVCTLGKHLGGVIFSDGKRCKHKSWCHLIDPDGSDSEEDHASSAKSVEDGSEVDVAFSPPAAGTEAWDRWTAKVDNVLLETMQSITTLDSVVIMPTGSAKLLAIDALQAALPRSMQAAAERGIRLRVVGQQEDNILRGAALGALAELQTEQMLQAFAPVLNGSKSLQALSEAQLRAVYRRLDINADGISLSEMQQGLQLLGIERDCESLYAELQGGQSGNVNEDAFLKWWWDHVRSARTIVITSVTAWRMILSSPPPPGYGDLVLLMLSFTWCRTCKRFIPKYQRLAELFPEVRFVQLVANGTVGAAELSNSLGVRQAPAFFLYRRGGNKVLASWKGVNTDEFQQKLRQFLPPFSPEESAGASDVQLTDAST